ncbi:hypothetical protein I316_06828 [Kwoniella heveanensis BCC8398]|uniref:Xylanolytic transcriptional activator regulatory domain-containing protein n=1 Tax=Kwoniella heveanensis BCC8398 TaxID=1296120 RepID=A0A1B9GK85_9TREE|nr:hypothetical protein I316_06828 [Kwoniella heveanensis BCC8398]
MAAGLSEVSPEASYTSPIASHAAPNDQTPSSAFAELAHAHLRHAQPKTHDLAAMLEPDHRPGGLPTTASANHFLATSDPVYSRPRLPRPVRKTPIPASSELSRLVHVYFSNRWPNYPIFYKSRFMVDVIDPIIHGTRTADDSAYFFLYMVMAIASIDSPGSEDMPSAIDYYTAATSFYLEDLIAADNLATIQGLLLLTGFALSDPRAVSLWHVTGLTIRMCIDHRLHQVPQIALNESDGLHTELKRRIFWCAFALDRSVSIALNQPLALPTEQITTALPILIDDPASAQNGAPGSPDIAAFVHTLRLRGQSGLIHATLHCPSEEPTLSECVSRPKLSADDIGAWRGEMRQKLEAWNDTAPRYPAPVTSTYKSKDWFMIAKSYTLLVLYRPSALYPESSPDVMQVCADASMTLIASYFRLYTLAKVTYTWVALHSLFLATITALYALQQSPTLRQSTSYEVVQMNLRGCSTLFAAMSQQWPAAKQCRLVAEYLTAQTLALFEQDAKAARDAAEAAMSGQSLPRRQAPDVPAWPSSGTLGQTSTCDRNTAAAASTISPESGFGDHFLDIQTDLNAWLELVDPSSLSTGGPTMDAAAFEGLNFGLDSLGPTLSGIMTPAIGGASGTSLSAADLDALLSSLPGFDRR